MIEHMKMVQILYLDIRSMLLSGQVPHMTSSSQLFWKRLFQKKQTNRGVWGDTFLKKTLDFFLFFPIPLGISGKTKLHLWKLGKTIYVTSLGNFNAKKSRVLAISHEFFSVSLGNSTLLLIKPWKLCMLFLEYSWKFYILTLSPCLGFFWNSLILKTLC